MSATAADEQLSVTGGVAGIEACYEDLLAMADLLARTAAAVEDAAAPLHASDRYLPAPGELTLGPTEAVRADAIRAGAIALGGPAGLGGLAERVRGLAAAIRSAAARYRRADEGILGWIVARAGEVAREVAVGSMELTLGHLGAAAARFEAAVPAAVDLAMTGGRWLEPVYADQLPDGRPVLHGLGVDQRPAARVAPRGLADLLAALTLRNAGRHGEISVALLVGADGRRRAVVDIPGTKSWNPLPNGDVTSVGTDITALCGRPTSYERGVFAALAAAGVGPRDEVMLVGHSEGGLVAVNAAAHAARSGRFRITRLVTAGAPVGRLVGGLPAGVQLLALENRADVVPRFDAADNPDRRNVVTVTVDQPSGGLADRHDLGRVYLPAAAAADRSADPSIAAFLADSRGFLDAPDVVTRGYRITRALPGGP